MQCTLSGTLYVYQGEEIGMANLPKEWSIEEYKDIASQTYYNEWVLRLRRDVLMAENSLYAKNVKAQTTRICRM